MDNPLDDLVDQAMSSNDTQLDEPVAQQVEANDVKPEVEQVQQQEPQEEKFSLVDPETLPDELKGTYKSLQADYTRKRQAESKLLKDLQRKIQDLETGSKPVLSPTVEDSTLTPEQRAREIARQTFREEQEKSWIEQAQSDYIRLDDRLDDNSPVHDPKLDSWLQNTLDDELAKHESESGSKTSFNYKERAKELIEEWDEYISSLNKKFIEKQKQMAKEQATKSAKFSPEVSQAKSKTTHHKVGLDEAFELALSE